MRGSNYNNGIYSVTDEKGVQAEAYSRQPSKMAAGSARYLRYIIFAFFVIAVIYFFSSSSIPTSNFPGGQWNTPVAADDVGGLGPNTGEALPVGGSSSGQESFAETPEKVETTPYSHSHDLTPSPLDASERVNATFVTLARNSDIWEIAKSIRHVEDRFNRNYGYDWVFLNDDEFSDEFKKITSALVSGKTHYGQIGKEHWGFPDFIDQEKARQVREDMKAKKIIYGDSISYRHMCRYESGFFFQHPIMLNFEYYWRVEPSIELYCDIDYDPFKFMKENKKKYSFVLSLYEYVETIPTLWDSVKKFMKDHPEHIVEDNSLQFLSDDGGDTYNHCHFWSNFEIGNLNWLRGKGYTDYFNSLDHDGGFFYERWGDAPVHSIAAGLMLRKDEIHFFNDIAYYHVPFTHCPTGEDVRLKLKCSCNPGENFDWKGYSCTSRFFEINGMQKPAGYENEQ